MGGKGEREGGTRNAAAAGCYIVLLTAAAFPIIRLAAARHLVPREKAFIAVRLASNAVCDYILAAKQKASP